MTTPLTPPASPPQRKLISRFTVLLLAAVLIGLDWGRSLPPELTDFCSVIGLAAMAIYVVLEFTAYRRATQHAETLRAAAEHRLTRQIDPVSGAETVVWTLPNPDLVATDSESQRS